jgi:hypothetical protein
MNNTVSIVYVINENYTSISSFNFLHHSKGLKEEEFIDTQEPTIVNKICDLEVEIVIGYDKNSNSKAIDYFKSIADNLIEVDSIKNECETYNKLFRNCSNEFVCVVKQNCFFEDGWLNELIAYSKIVDKVGCMSIVSNFTTCEFISVMTNDSENMLGVYLPKEEFFDVYGVLFFPRQHLYYIGALDCNPTIKNCVFEQWQMRCARYGLNNFAIPTQSCIYIPQESIIKTTIDYKNANNSVEEMRKNKSFYIPLDVF